MAGKKISPTLLKIPIKKKFNSEDRVFIAQEIIDIIVNRTEKGKAPDGKRWSGKAGKYSDSYINSNRFKRRGKNKSKIDLKLSSDMLNSMELVDHSEGEIIIGYSESNPQQGKAEGNILGTYGNSTRIPGKSRDFLKISSDEKSMAMNSFDPTFSTLKEIEKRRKSLEKLLAVTPLPREET